MQLSKKKIFKLLNTIPDPEIPVINIVELGVIRDVLIDNDNSVTIIITPTYSGCPAMKQMEDDIKLKLIEQNISNIKINYQYNPPWTTDWLNDEAKLKLQKYGIAPPQEKTSDKSFITGVGKKIVCPHCKSNNTNLVSQFGSTACKALYKCNNCLEAFDYFKCI
jgi:ring-1,2-phenylacetyl-CoA epoxidase subunit PaaD